MKHNIDYSFDIKSQFQTQENLSLYNLNLLADIDLNEINSLVSLLKPQFDDRNLLKLFDACLVLTSHTLSLQSTFISLRSAFDIANGNYLSSQLTIHSLTEQLKAKTAQNTQMENSLIEIEAALNQQQVFNKKLLQQLRIVSQKTEQMTVESEKREKQQNQENSKVIQQIKISHEKEVQRLTQQKDDEFEKLERTIDELTDQNQQLLQDLSRLDQIDKRSTGGGPNSYSPEKSQLKIQVVPRLLFHTQSTEEPQQYNNSPKHSNSSHRSSSSSQNSFHPLSLLDEDFNLNGLKSNREDSTYRKIEQYCTTERQFEQQNFSPNGGQKCQEHHSQSEYNQFDEFDKLVQSIVLSKQQLWQTINKNEQQEWL